MRTNPSANNLDRPQGVQIGEHNSQTNHHYGPKAQWAVGIAAAVVVGSGLTIATVKLLPAGSGSAGSAVQTDHVPSRTTSAAGLPLTVAVLDRTSPCGSGWLLPDGSDAGPPPASANSDDDFRAWAKQTGAVAVDDNIVELDVQGVSDAQVTIRGIRVKIVRRLKPERGTAYGLACGGDGIYRWVGADLDTNPPKMESNVNSSIDPDDAVHTGPIKFPYKVALSDTELFLVGATTKTCLCDWAIEVDWSSQGRSGTLEINDGGKPFRTTTGSAMQRSCNKMQGQPLAPATDCRSGQTS